MMEKKPAPVKKPKPEDANHTEYAQPEVTTYSSDELEERIGPALTGSAWN